MCSNCWVKTTTRDERIFYIEEKLVPTQKTRDDMTGNTEKISSVPKSSSKINDLWTVATEPGETAAPFALQVEGSTFASDKNCTKSNVILCY